MTEEWRPVTGWEGLYSVSDQGRVRCEKRHRVPARILTPSEAGKGYRKVQLAHKDRRSHRYVHDLVLSAFVGERPLGQEGAHGNGVRCDNRLANLRWDTRSGNHRDKHRHGTANTGERHPGHKLTIEQVRIIRASSESCTVLGRRFGVARMQISRIKNRQTWGSVV